MPTSSRGRYSDRVQREEVRAEDFAVVATPEGGERRVSEILLNLAKKRALVVWAIQRTGGRRSTSIPHTLQLRPIEGEEKIMPFGKGSSRRDFRDLFFRGEGKVGCNLLSSISQRKEKGGHFSFNSGIEGSVP